MKIKLNCSPRHFKARCSHREILLNHSKNSRFARNERRSRYIKFKEDVE